MNADLAPEKPSDLDMEPPEPDEPSDLDDSDLDDSDVPCTDDLGGTSDESQWEALIPDEDEREPEPDPGDFWIDDGLLAAPARCLLL